MATPTQSDAALQPPAGSLAGREREQAALAARLTAALAGQGSLVLVGGEAGIGKTTLVSWLATEARQRGARVLTGYCQDLTQTPPYGPWREAFARAGMASDRSADPPPLPWGDDLGAVTSQSLLFDQIRQYLIRETAAGPLTVVLEDMHWSDPASLELLLHVVRGIDSLPLLLIATYRDDEITPREPLFALLPLLARAPHVERITIGALTGDAIQTLVTRRYALPEEDRARLVTFLQIRSGGNALYVMELLRTLEAERLLHLTADGWHLGDLERAPLPRLIRQIVEGRLANIDGEFLELLEMAAVIGQDVPLDILEAASGADRDRIAMALATALEVRLIVESEDTMSLEFTHALVRESLYDRQTLAERQMRHRRVAEVLASRPDPPLSVVATHFARGDDPRAVDWLVRSGEQALVLYAARDAITALTRAHDLAGRFSQPLPPAAYRARAAAATLIGEFDDARRDYELALDRGRAIGDRHTAWQALLDLGMLWAERDYERTIGYYRAALALAREIGDKPMIAYSLNRVGNWHVNLDEPDAALPLHEEALELFTTCDDHAGIADSLDCLGLAAYLNADFPRSTMYCERAIPIFRETGDRQRLSSCLTLLTVTGGDLTWAAAPLYREPGYWIRCGEEGLRIAREIGWPAGEAFALMCLSLALVTHGDLRRAMRDAHASLALAERIAHHQWTVAARQALATIWIELLEPSRAIAELEPALVTARISGSRFWTNTIVAALASLHVSMGDLHQAAAVLGSVAETAKPHLALSQRQCRFARAELSLAEGDPGRALAILDELARTQALSTAAGDVPQIMKLRGDTLARLHRATEAEQAYLAARKSARVLGFRPLLWRIDCALGALYLTRDRTSEAEEAFRNARTTISDIAATIEDPLLREQFQSRALAHLPARPALARGSISATRLSSRELDVLRLLVEGKPDREIAAALFISPRTVMRHVTSILDKLNVSSRTAAAAAAIRQGII
jgi:DNA-binding CsgD family transcriptional regulator/tetratricopeptide (TPR) repeat protein